MPGSAVSFPRRRDRRRRNRTGRSAADTQARGADRRKALRIVAYASLAGVVTAVVGLLTA